MFENLLKYLMICESETFLVGCKKRLFFNSKMQWRHLQEGDELWPTPYLDMPGGERNIESKQQRIHKGIDPISKQEPPKAVKR